MTKKTLKKTIEEKNTQLKIYDSMLSEYKEENNKLQKELNEARCLKAILEKLEGKVSFYSGKGILAYLDGDAKIELPDDVLRYVDDILGGKVVKQEGNKCIVIDKDGNVKTGLTKKKVDKGYAYKLVRE